MDSTAPGANIRNPVPSSWTVERVLEWAEKVGLPPAARQALAENEVDGSTLVTLRKEELRSELGITSLPARRYLWDKILTIRKQQDSMDHASAIMILRQEIDQQEKRKNISMSGLDTSGEGNIPPIDATALALLKDDTTRNLQILTDHLFALRLHNGQNLDFQVYEDSNTAQQEQMRLDKLSIMSEYDRSVAKQLSEQLDPRSSRWAPAPSTPSTLFGLCIQTCVRNHINVGQALSSGRVRPIPRWRIPVPGLLESATNERYQDVNQRKQDTSRLGRSEPTTTRHPTSTSSDTRSVEILSSEDRKKALKKLHRVDQCHVCYAENERGFILACGHKQCVDCMRRHLHIALNDRSLLPLKCCEQPVDMDTLGRLLLRPSQVALLRSRVQEVTATNKMYCPKCSRFINLDLVDRQGSNQQLQCECRQMLCVECKTATHTGLSCAQNKQAPSAADQGLMRLAESQGWKQCPKCSIMIELQSGCFHMTCVNCAHEFCFRCLSAWNVANSSCATGLCPQWEERRLLEAAEARVDAQLADEARARRNPAVLGRVGITRSYADAVGPGERQERVQRAMQALRNNEGCFHQWVRRNVVGGNCERCGYDLWVYRMVCQGGCEATVCYTCAHHRIPRWGWR